MENGIAEWESNVGVTDSRIWATGTVFWQKTVSSSVHRSSELLADLMDRRRLIKGEEHQCITIASQHVRGHRWQKIFPARFLSTDQVGEVCQESESFVFPRLNIINYSRRSFTVDNLNCYVILQYGKHTMCTSSNVGSNLGTGPGLYPSLSSMNTQVMRGLNSKTKEKQTLPLSYHCGMLPLGNHCIKRTKISIL